MKNHKIIIGIMGAIASGKSAAAAEFARLGCAVIDADAIVYDLLKDQNVIDNLKKALGPEITNEDGTINRYNMAGIVFKSEKNVKLTNSIIHPLVFQCINSLIKKYNQSEDIKAIVLDMPLLLEVGWHEKCDFLVFVDASESNRVQRAEKKVLRNEKNLKNRQKFQISLDNKADIAHYTINNNSDLQALADQVVRIFTSIMNK